MLQQQAAGPRQHQQYGCFQGRIQNDCRERSQMIHTYLPSCCAFLMSWARYCLSFEESFRSDISSRAATALSGDPPKKVVTMCSRAELRTLLVSSAAR